MFTVVISSKKVREDCQKKYKRFLEPLFDSEKFVFCDWDITGDSIDSAVPELKHYAAENKEWRAVIVEDGNDFGNGKIIEDEQRRQKNPYDFVNCTVRVDDLKSVDEVSGFRAEKYAAYEKAVSNPLVKLGTWLCEGCVKNKPELDEKFLEVSRECGDEYKAWLDSTGTDICDAEYDLCRNKKYEIVSQFYNPDLITFNRPNQVLCIAPRTFDDDKLFSKLAWAKTDEFDYSVFYDDNLYPNKLRYLIYDIPYFDHQNYESEYVNFLLFLLIFAGNEYPVDVLRANRVYKINCETDDNALSTFLSLYDFKLSNTGSYLARKINELNNRTPQILSESELNDYFLFDSNVPVRLDDDFDQELLKAEYRKIGLSRDCPTEEMDLWKAQFTRIIKNFKFFMKQPRRSLSRASDYVRENDTANLEKASAINKFQEEDVEEKLYEDERKMIETRIQSVCNTKPYFKAFSDSDKEIRRTIRTRMTKKTTIILSLVVLLIYLAGFIPLFVSNLKEDGALSVASTMTICAGLAMAAFGFTCLFFLRSKLVKKIRAFNEKMNEIVNLVFNGMSRSAEYLGKICDILRINSVLNYLHQDHDETSIQCSVYKNHIEQIEKERRECGYIFSKFINKKSVVTDIEDFEPYEYDYTKDVEYEYKVPSRLWSERNISFMQRDNVVAVPVNFVKSISVEREELFNV